MGYVGPSNQNVAFCLRPQTTYLSLNIITLFETECIVERPIQQAEQFF